MSDFYSLLEEKIEAIRADPNRSRQVVYDLARYALKNKIYGSSPLLTAAQVAQQMIALEAAIALVEAKTAGNDVTSQKKNDPPEIGEVSFSLPDEPAREVASDYDVIRPSGRRNARRDLVVLPPRNLRRDERFADETYTDRFHTPHDSRDLRVSPEAVAVIQMLVNERNSRSRRVLSWIDGLLRVGVIAAIAFAGYVVWSGKLTELLLPVVPAPVEVAKDPPPQPDPAPAEPAMLQPSVPVPTGYGVYAIHQDRLFSLNRAPATPVDPRARHLMQITEPSRSIFADGRLTFAIYRRDLATAAPVSVPVRIAARIAGTLRTGPGGTLVNVRPDVDTWLIYSAGYIFRTHPVPSNPEMILVRPDDPDLVLPPGRYVLLMNDEPYEFSVAGEVTDPRSCVEGFPTPHGPVFHVCKAENKSSG